MFDFEEYCEVVDSLAHAPLSETGKGKTEDFKASNNDLIWYATISDIQDDEEYFETK